MRKRKFDWSVLHPPQSPVPAPPGPPAPVDGGPAAPARNVAPMEPSAGNRTPSVTLRVNDMKQYAYCPRIVFYQYAMPVQRAATVKMEHGKAIEPGLERLEGRRTLRQYGLAEGRRDFQVWLRSERLGLSGRLDLLITTPCAAFPVDFKDTRERVQHNHHVQLCAYALLVEERSGQGVPAGFIYRVPRDDVVAVDITPALRVETLAMGTEIREMIAAERMPPPTPVRAHCTDCEYRNYCGDIF